MPRPRYSFSSKHTRQAQVIKKQKDKFPAILRKLVDKCDILIEVLDARFIAETRNKDIEELIKKKGKRLIYVLNKTDLIDKSELSKRGLKELFPYVLVSTKNRTGSKMLRDRIKMEAKKVEEQIDLKIQVGILGYPNTGKSSIINFLRGKASARSSASAGFTKGMQKINLTNSIVMIDSPGVIPDSKYSAHKLKEIIHHAKVGARDYGKIKDPETVVFRIIDEYKSAFEKAYKTKIKDIEEFISDFGEKNGLLKRGGETNMDKASRLLLKDWQEGRIKI